MGNNFPTKGRLDLGGKWKVTWTDGQHGPNFESTFIHVEPQDPDKYLEVKVPQELHLALREQGLCEDENFGINSLKSRWVSEQYWRYVTEFEAPAEALENECWLTFEQLDINATVLLNGEVAGTHCTAFRPARFPVSSLLKAGLNRLVVAIESGLYYVADKPGREYLDWLHAVLSKRHWLRKPQYQFGWDWNPRLINVGITGDVGLEWTETARLDQITCFCELDEDFKSARVHVRAFIEGLSDYESQLELTARVKETAEQSVEQLTLSEGIKPYETVITMDNPRLWWPRGHGDQPLYTLEIELRHGEQLLTTRELSFGVRTAEIDRSEHPEGGEYFILKVNGRNIFCKGGNWVPPDMIYSDTSRQKLERLVDLALEANFNLLRIWGGGGWAGHELLELCDKHGLLVWHDFMFACAKYPGDDPDFLEEVRKETTWGVREFSRHPSLFAWCGNNELEMANWDWGFDKSGKSLPDYALYHHVMPVIVKREDPSCFYWPSSPFSPDNQPPNSPYSGDQHPWDVTLGKYPLDFWKYRTFVDRYPNEGGILGATGPATLRDFLPPDQHHYRSMAWDHHDNSMSYILGQTPITTRLVEHWLDIECAKVDLEDYLFASALLQAEGMSEYICNYRRRMFTSSAAIFWMYNDSWPVTHGWTIVDYYLRRKLCYHPVRRAFETISVVVAQDDDGENIRVFGVNDGPTEVRGKLRYGIFSLAGELPLDQEIQGVLPANCSVELANFSSAMLAELGLNSHGAFALLDYGNGKQARHRLLLKPFKDLELAQPEIKLERRSDKLIFTSDVFVWGVTLDFDGDSGISDDCFDLFPGIAYSIDYPVDKETPTAIRTGNALSLLKKSKG